VPPGRIGAFLGRRRGLLRNLAVMRNVETLALDFLLDPQANRPIDELEEDQETMT
jgi:hypothetical protein